MDKRNFRKTEKVDRKHEKGDKVDLKKVEKQLKKIVELSPHVLRQPGDLQKVDKQAKKSVDIDINHTKVPPDRGDLKKVERQAKKADPDVKTLADRGDLKRVDKQTKKTVESDANDPKVLPDRSDSDSNVIKIDKPKLNVVLKKSDDRPRNVDYGIPRENLKKIEIDTVRTVPDDKRKIREQYTLKLRNPPVTSLKTEEQAKLRNYFKLQVTENKNDRASKKTVEPPKEKSDESIELKQSIVTIANNKSDKKDLVRKPIIKTISSQNDKSKIYKAVTFVDQKKKPTMLQIKIPDEIKNPKNLKSTETMTVKKLKATLSGISIKEKPRKHLEKRKHKRRRHVASPDLSAKARSPPTEVAKWAPSSINRHTKPYYEAWVNTTLAAISKNSRKDKLFLEKQNILQSFQRALAERPETPELVYENFNDERYTGIIKVKHR